MKNDYNLSKAMGRDGEGSIPYSTFGAFTMLPFFFFYNGKKFTIFTVLPLILSLSACVKE